MSINKKNLFNGFVLNFIAGVLPIAIMQLIVYPLMSANMDNASYGESLTFYSLLMMIPNSFGIVLSDLRMLYNKEYRDNNIEGDFKRLLLIFMLPSCVITLITAKFCFVKFDLIEYFLCCVTSLLVYFNAYLFVELVLKKDYKKILVNAIWMSIGYVIGITCLIAFKLWQLVYLVPFLFSTIYLGNKTDLLKEKNIKTKYYLILIKEYFLLLFSTIVTNAISYADRFVLFPLLGGTSVAIYYTASILGKLISMVSAPINRMILGTISDKDRLGNKLFSKMLIIVLFFHLIAYAVCILITKPILTLLYPKLVTVVMPYVPVATAASVLAAMASMLQPFVLRYTQVKWQSFIHISSAIVYFLSALLLQQYFGLIGFCTGALIGFIYKILLMIFIYFKFKKESIVV